MSTGTIKKVAGPLVIAEGMRDANMFDVVRVSSQRLIGEIIEIHGDEASIQVYEETSGLGPGEPVESMGVPMSVELGPGLITSIYDGIQRPLDDIMKISGNNLKRGVEVASLKRDKKWEFVPVAKAGDEVEAGDVLGTVQETIVVQQKIMVPYGVKGTVKEIKAGATLEQMEYHWINPDADQTLQRGLDENADDKQCAIACIRVDEAGLAEFYELFHPERYSYKKNSPCCEFQYPVKEHLVELSFRMNEAGLSKMGTDWLRQLKERLDSGEWLTHTPEGEPEGILTGVFVDQTRRIGLVYQQPGDDQYFQIFLNPDGTKADAF